MKKVILSVLAIAFAGTIAIANTAVSAKHAKAKTATCTSCPKGAKCDKPVCLKADCCK